MISRYQVNYQLRSHRRDQFIEFIKGLLLPTFLLNCSASTTTATQQEIRQQSMLQIFQKVEELVRDHIDTEPVRQGPSRLQSLVSGLGNFFTPLPLADAFLLADERYGLSQRCHVPPSFNDIRRILNTAQISAISPQLKLITFDGDITLYEDGECLVHEQSPIVRFLVDLLRMGINVAIVTAAGYTEALRYEQRLEGLLRAFESESSPLSAEMIERFWIVGGECNYLLQYNPSSKHLEYLEFEDETMSSWSVDKISLFLDIVEETLVERISSLKMRAKVLRKERAIGLVATTSSTLALETAVPITYRLQREQLDECVLSVNHAIQTRFKYALPFCAFNGGSDVWVDIGNKRIGVKLLQDRLSSKPWETLHVGDQFLSIGNDYATRNACCTIWVDSPLETEQFLSDLISLRKLS